MNHCQAALGSTVTAFKPQSPARQLTEDSMIQSVVHTKSDIIICVPRFLEVMCEPPYTASSTHRSEDVG